MSIYRLADAETMDAEGFFVKPNGEGLSPFESLSCLPSQDVPIELVQLSLVSVNPLTVSWDYKNKLNSENNSEWAIPSRGVYCAVVHATDVAGNVENTGTSGPFAYTFVPTPPAPPPPPAPTPTPPPSGGGGNGPIVGLLGGGGGNGPITPQGQVLGATTELPAGCTAYLNEYIKLGRKNNTDEVKKLQAFLNSLGEKLPVTGFYGALSYAAVKNFQVKAAEQILNPWISATGNVDKTGTGYVYKTTKRWINLLNCPTLNLPMPQLP